MEEWKEYKLGEITNMKNGKKRPQNNGIFPVYGGNGIMDYSDSYNAENVIIVGRVGAYCGCVYKCDSKCWVSDNAISVFAKDIVDTQFLYYLMTTQDFHHHHIGGAQPLMTQDIIGDFTVSIPPLPVQNQIVHILKSLDDKIEVNRQINDNLEQQAQALFKSWFVDFEPFKNGEFVESELGMIPKGWRVVTLDEMTSKFGTGLNPRKNFKLGEGNNYYVTIKNMGNNRVYLDERCDKVTDEAIEKINKRSKLQAGDLLFSGIGTIGRVALITETPTNWNTSESVFNLHPAENISSEFLYILLLSDVFQQYVKLHAQGGVQQGIRMASLKEYKMAIPGNNILREFDQMTKPIVSLVKKNDDETDRLATLRDSLLPKLMSGEFFASRSATIGDACQSKKASQAPSGK